MEREGDGLSDIVEDSSVSDTVALGSAPTKEISL